MCNMESGNEREVDLLHRKRVKFALMTFAGYECVYWVVIKQWQYMIVLILVGHTSDIEYIEERHRLERIPISNDCRFSLGNGLCTF